jgi:hypothetical protein
LPPEEYYSLRCELPKVLTLLCDLRVEIETSLVRSFEEIVLVSDKIINCLNGPVS